MGRRISLIIILFLFAAQTEAQCQGINNHWLMGYSSWGGSPYGHTRFDFLTGNLVSSFDSLEMDFKHTHASIADSAGNLLFYTNGIYIADATHDTMLNGSGLSPSAFTTYAAEGMFIPQACLILKRPDNYNLYDVFHSTWDNWPSTTGVLAFHLYYSIVDMNANGGLGAVVTKNFAVISDSLIPGKIIACRHANGRDWWIIVFKAYSNTIYSLLLTPTGLVFSGMQNEGMNRYPWYYGQAKFSPNGKKLVLYNPMITSNGSLEVFNFDRCTGNFEITDSLKLPIAYTANCGTEFSPNSNYLYITTGDSIFQYDVNAPNLAVTKTPVAVMDGFYQPGAPALVVGLCHPQLAPDGKIYITSGNSTSYLGKIENPDVGGVGCNVQQHCVLLPALNYNTLPNHPNYFLGCDTTSGCPCLTTGFSSNSENLISVQAYPNPTQGVFALAFPVFEESGTVEVFDILGNSIIIENISPWSTIFKLDITNLPSGIYHCHMKWKYSTAQIRILKQ